MDEFEKVEKLRQRANVSYEEAKEALRNSNGDLLDAMIYLEKQGKTTPGQETVERCEGTVEKSVPACCGKKEERRENARKECGKFKDFCAKMWVKGNDNEFVMERRENTIIRIPVWVFVVLVIFTFEIALPAMLVSLFFDCRYHFEGKDNLDKVNDVMNQAGDAAEKIKADLFTKEQ